MAGGGPTKDNNQAREFFSLVTDWSKMDALRSSEVVIIRVIVLLSFFYTYFSIVIGILSRYNCANYRFQKYLDSLKSMKTYKIDCIYELLEDTHDAIFFRTFSAI